MLPIAASLPPPPCSGYRNALMTQPDKISAEVERKRKKQLWRHRQLSQLGWHIHESAIFPVIYYLLISSAYSLKIKKQANPGFTHKTSVNNLALHRMFIYHLHPHNIWRQQAISFSTDSWDMYSIQQSILLCGKVAVFLDRVGNSARGGRERGGLWYIHVAQAARDCVVRLARRDWG
jgi:hypothetical protein